MEKMRCYVRHVGMVSQKRSKATEILRNTKHKKYSTDFPLFPLAVKYTKV